MIKEKLNKEINEEHKKLEHANGDDNVKKLFVITKVVKEENNEHEMVSRTNTKKNR